MSDAQPLAMTSPRGFVLPATEAHAMALIKAGFRQQDIDEVTAMGRDPAEALLQSLEVSKPNAFTLMASVPGEKDAVPVCIFGATQLLGIPHHGVVWMLASDELYTIVDDFVAQADAWIDHLNEVYAVLVNFVDERNTVSRRWLENTGFVFDGGAEAIGDTTFIRFFRAGMPASH